MVEPLAPFHAPRGRQRAFRESKVFPCQAPRCSTLQKSYGQTQNQKTCCEGPFGPMPSQTSWRPGSCLCTEAPVPIVVRQAEEMRRRRQPESRRLCVLPLAQTRRWLEVVTVCVLAVICIVPYASCLRHYTASHLDVGGTADVNLASSYPNEGIERAASMLMHRQLAQMEQQQMLEALASPFLTREPNSPASMIMRGAREIPLKLERQSVGPSMVDLGSLLVGGAEGATEEEGTAALRPAESRAAAGAAAQVPFSFINWGQIGGMMQSPALAHTGMPVYMPRRAVGTTVGLDFDSPATFHGPLLVAIMVCILVFFVVLMLCCWMVKSKQKHDKFMAEKIPRPH